MVPRVSEVARIFLVAAFLVLVAQGPTFSTNRAGLVAAANCTQTTGPNGGIITKCDEPNANKEVTIDDGGKSDTKITDECTQENIATWRKSGSVALQQKAQACESKPGTQTAVGPDGKKLDVTCKEGDKCGAVTQGSGSAPNPSAVDQYAAGDSKPYISQTPLPADAQMRRTIEGAFPGVSDGSTKLAYPVNPPAPTGSGINDIEKGPMSSVPGTELDYSRPPSVNLNDNIRSNVVALNSSEGSVPLMETARSYLPVSSGASGFDGKQGFAYDFSKTGAAQYGGLFGTEGAPAFDFSSTPAAQYAGTFSADDVFGNSDGIGAQPADTSRPGLNVYYGPNGDDYVETLSPDTILQTKDGRTFTAAYLIDNGEVNVKLSDLEKSLNLSYESLVTRQTADSDGKLLSSNTYSNLNDLFDNLQSSTGVLDDGASTRITPTPDNALSRSLETDTSVEPLQVSVISSKDFEKLQQQYREAQAAPSPEPSLAKLAFVPERAAALLTMQQPELISSTPPQETIRAIDSPSPASSLEPKRIAQNQNTPDRVNSVVPVQDPPYENLRDTGSLETIETNNNPEQMTTDSGYTGPEIPVVEQDASSPTGTSGSGGVDNASPSGGVPNSVDIPSLAEHPFAQFMNTAPNAVKKAGQQLTAALQNPRQFLNEAFKADTPSPGPAPKAVADPTPKLLTTIEGTASCYDPTNTTSCGGSAFEGGMLTATGKYIGNKKPTAALQLAKAKEIGCGYAGKKCTALVTDVTTGKSVVVTIDDNGPLFKGRVIDLSSEAMEQLGGKDIAKVKVEIFEKGTTLAQAEQAKTKSATPAASAELSPEQEERELQKEAASLGVSPEVYQIPKKVSITSTIPLPQPMLLGGPQTEKESVATPQETQSGSSGENTLTGDSGKDTLEDVFGTFDRGADLMRQAAADAEKARAAWSKTMGQQAAEKSEEGAKIAADAARQIAQQPGITPVQKQTLETAAAEAERLAGRIVQQVPKIGLFSDAGVPVLKNQLTQAVTSMRSGIASAKNEIAQNKKVSTPVAQNTPTSPQSTPSRLATPAPTPSPQKQTATSPAKPTQWSPDAWTSKAPSVEQARAVIRDVSQLYAKHFGFDASSFNQSMNAVFQIETNGVPNAKNESNNRYEGSFQLGPDEYKNWIAQAQKDLTEMQRKGIITNEQYDTFQKVLRSTTSDPRFNHLLNTVAALSEHARSESRIQKHVSDPRLRAAFHQGVQLIPTLTKKTLTEGADKTLGTVSAKALAQNNITGVTTVMDAVRKMATGANGFAKKIAAGIARAGGIEAGAISPTYQAPSVQKISVRTAATSPITGGARPSVARPVSLCIGSTNCTGINANNYINSLCQSDRGCTAQNLGAQPNKKYNERIMTDAAERAADYARQIAVAGKYSNGNQPVLIDNCQFAGTCTEIRTAIQKWNTEHPDKTLIPMVNNPLLVAENLGQSAAQDLMRTVAQMGGGAILENGAGSLKENDAFRKAIGYASMPILALANPEGGKRLAEEIIGNALENIGTSISSEIEGGSGYRDGMAGLPIALGTPETGIAERALTNYARGLGGAVRNLTQENAEATRQKVEAGAQDAVARGYQAAQLGSHLGTPVVIENTGNTNIVRDSDGTQIGAIRTLPKAHAQVAAAARAQNIPIRACATGFCTADGKQLSIQTQNTSLSSGAKEVVPTRYGGRVVKLAGVPLQRMTHEEYVNAFREAGLRVEDRSRMNPIPSIFNRPTVGARMIIHGDLLPGNKLVNYEANMLASGKPAAQGVIKEDGTVVILHRLDQVSYHAPSSNALGPGFETAGADDGRPATSAQFDAQTKMAAIALQRGMEVGTHGQAEPGRRNAIEGGAGIVSYLYGNGPLEVSQTTLVATDATGAVESIGKPFSESRIASIGDTPIFESTDSEGRPDGKVSIPLEKIPDMGKVEAKIVQTEDGKLDIEIEYTPPTPPAPPTPTIAERAWDTVRDTVAPVQQKMQDMLKQIQSMFGGGQSGGGKSGGGSGSGSSPNTRPSQNPQPVPPVPIPNQPNTAERGSFTCAPNTVVNNASTTPLRISWKCPAGSSAIGAGFSTGGAREGNLSITVATTSATARYALTCSGSVPQTFSCAVRVLHPVVALVSRPEEVKVGESVLLRWNALDVQSCELYAPPSLIMMRGGMQGEAKTLPLTQTSEFAVRCKAGEGVWIAASTTVRIEGYAGHTLKVELPVE